MTAKTQNRIALALVRGGLTFVQLVVALGTSAAVVASMLLAGAAQYAHAATVGDGPSPAAQTSANTPQARLTIHYNRVFMQWLYMHLNKLLLCTHMDLPEKSGQTFRNFMAITLGADTQQQTEGTLGNPEQINYNFRDIVVGQWANYNNLSDFVFMTSISNDLEENRRIMAYQLGQTIDDLTMYMFDYLRTFDTRTTNQDSTTSPFPFTKSMLVQMPGSLAGATVPPMNTGKYNGSIHHFFVSDLQLDNSNRAVEARIACRPGRGPGERAVHRAVRHAVAPVDQPDAVRELAELELDGDFHLPSGQGCGDLHQLPQPPAHQDRSTLGEHEPVGGRVCGAHGLRSQRADHGGHGVQRDSGRGPAAGPGINQPRAHCQCRAADELKARDSGTEGLRD